MRNLKYIIAIIILLTLFAGTGYAGDAPTRYFYKLRDTPSTYAGVGTYCLKVNAGATAVEFVACETGSHSSFLTAESDPQVGDVTSGYFCKGTGTQASCTDSSTYLTSETDDQTASEVPFTPSGGIIGTDVDAALRELDVESNDYLDSSNIASSISDSDTTHCPDGNSVYDALALKAPLISPVFTTPNIGSATGTASGNALAPVDYSVGNCGAATTVNWSNGTQQYVTLDQATCALTFSNPVVGTLSLRLIQGSGGTKVLTYVTTIRWAGGVAPTLSTTAAKVDWIICRYSGAEYFCDVTVYF